MPKWPSVRFEAGMSLAEVVIAAGLLVFVGLALASYLGSIRTSNIVVEGKGQSCDRAYALISGIKKKDHKLDAVNWHSVNGQTTMLPLDPWGAQGWAGAIASMPIISATSANWLTANTGANTVTFDTTNAWTLTDTSANWMLQLYMSPGTVNVCDMAGDGRLLVQGGTSIADRFYPPGNPINNSEQIFMNVKRKNMSTGVLDCNARSGTRIIPVGKNNTAGPAYGFEVSARVRFTDPSGVVQSCKVSTTIHPDGDPYLPQASSPPGNVNPPGCAGGPGPQCVSSGSRMIGIGNPPLAFYTTAPLPTSNVNTDWYVSVAYNEPGIVLGCDLKYNPPVITTIPPGVVPAAAPGAFRPCTQFTIDPGSGNQVTVSIDQSISPPQKGSGILTAARIKISGIQVVGFYTLFVKAFDVAQNETVATGTQFCQAYCPPPNQYCAGTVYPDGCGGSCPTGSLNNCAPPDTYCGTYTDECGNTCNGTNCPTNNPPTPACPTSCAQLEYWVMGELRGCTFSGNNECWCPGANNPPPDDECGGEDPCWGYNNCEPGPHNPANCRTRWTSPLLPPGCPMPGAGYCFECDTPHPPEGWPPGNPGSCTTGCQNAGQIPCGDPVPPNPCPCSPPATCTVSSCTGTGRDCGPQEICIGGVCEPMGPCFAAGTMIATPKGNMAIEKLKVDDQVYSFNEKTGRVETDTVKKTFVHKDKYYGQVELSDGAILRVTREHRFYLAKAKKWKAIGKLKEGDMLLKQDSHTVTIKKLDFAKTQKSVVYNIHVGKNQNYFAEGVLVHNIKY